MKKLILILIFLIACVMVTGCFENTTTTKPLTDPTTTKEKNYHIFTKDPYIDLYSGEMKFIEYTTDFEIEDGEKMTFTSSNQDVARCIQTGYVIAKSKGECTITVSYKNASLLFYVTVSQDSSITPPSKLTYYTDETLDLTGASIILYNQDKTIADEIEITSDMVDACDMSTKGEKEVQVTYGQDTYHFTINVIEREYEPYLLDSINIGGNLYTGKTVEFNIRNKNINNLLENVKSVYDYDEYKIVIDIERPDSKVDTIYTYYNQDYTENRKPITMSQSKNMEGTVISKEGYNYLLELRKSGEPYYKGKYVPEVSGNYSYTVKAYSYKNTLVDMINGEFTVENSKNKGTISVSENNMTFEFSDGSSYLPVGENLAWYTSQERRYIDYEMWMKSLKEVGANYIRVWLSGFSFSLFWDNLYDYTTKLDEAYELDRIFSLAEEYGIYINLTLFHHGMFSRKVNPMWPNDVNDWYIGKYGVNPYSKILSSPGDFFTQTEAKNLTKNYLTYIVSRYGYSNNLFSYELFNEVDWVEEYEKNSGNIWHDEMANHLKSIDSKNHLVTTSLKDDDLNSDASSVFKLKSIDYINVHCYGSSNYYKTISNKAVYAYSSFNKPIIYQEVGYDGNSGQSQINKDPNDVTLHQELWAGLMGSGASGMNWWWDSWIEPHNSYSMFKAPAIIAKIMTIDKTAIQAYKSSRLNVGTGYTGLGYLMNDKAYLYVYSNKYTLTQTNNQFNTSVKITGLSNGTYELKTYDTFTGNVKDTRTVTVSNGTFSSNVQGTDDCFISLIKIN